MDREPTLNDVVMAIRDTLREYAKTRGWPPKNYRILMDYHATWPVIHVVLFSKEFRRINSDDIADEMEYYNQIMDIFEGTFKDSPEVYQAIGLLLRPLDEYYPWSYRGSPEGTVEIDDALLNPDLKPEELRGPIGSRM